jgi:hypothetical protein
MLPLCTFMPMFPFETNGRISIKFGTGFLREPGQLSYYTDYVMDWTIGVHFPARAMMGFFVFATASRPALGPIQLPIQWVSGALRPGVQQLGRQAD